MKVNNSLLQLKKDYKPTNISIDQMHKFEAKEITKKKIFAKNTWQEWYNLLINYIPEFIKQKWVVLKANL